VFVVFVVLGFFVFFGGVGGGGCVGGRKFGYRTHLRGYADLHSRGPNKIKKKQFPKTFSPTGV